MANTSSLLAIASGVRAFFKVQNPNVSVAITGWKQRAQQLNQGQPTANRVCFIPGDLQGRDGALVRGRNTGGSPRALLEWDRLVTMSVWAIDTTDTANDELQVAAVENLLEQAIQACHLAVGPDGVTPVGCGAIHWGAVRWTVVNQEMASGREVLVDFTLKSLFFDLPIGVAFPQPAIEPTPVVP